MNVAPVQGGFLTGKKLIFPIALVTSLFFLWGFSYGLLDVLNKHFQEVLDITKLQSTGLQVMYFGGGTYINERRLLWISGWVANSLASPFQATSVSRLSLPKS